MNLDTEGTTDTAIAARRVTQGSKELSSWGVLQLDYVIMTLRDLGFKVEYDNLPQMDDRTDEP